MPQPITQREEELREEFKKKFADNTYTNIVAAGPNEVSDWWLAKLSSTLQSYKEGLIAEIGEDEPIEQESDDVNSIVLKWSNPVINQERQRIRAIINTNKE